MAVWITVQREETDRENGYENRGGCNRDHARDGQRGQRQAGRLHRRIQGAAGLRLGASVVFNGKGVPKQLSLSYGSLMAPCSADPSGSTLLPLSGAYSDPKLKKRSNKYAFSAGGGVGVENGILKGTISKGGKKMEGKADDSATFGAAGECSIEGAEFTAKPK